MGLLDDAIREHLELKRAHGASSEELSEKEAEAFGPARRERVAPEPADELPVADEALEQEPPVAGEPPVDAPPIPDEPPAFEPVAEEPTRMLEPEPADFEPVREELVEPTAEDEELLEPVPEPPEPEPVQPEPAQPESEPVEPEPRAAEPPPEEPPRPGDTPTYGVPAVESDPADEIFAEEPAEPAAAEEEDEDVLEETPDFLQETPEHDRLWFEQKPPRDFDFDDD